jgi:hypothetical protein
MVFHMPTAEHRFKQFVRELEQFFVNYHELSGEQYRVIDVRGPGQARKRIEDGIRAARRG